MDNIRPWPTPPPSFAVVPEHSALVLIDFQRYQAERGCGLAGRIEREFPVIASYFFSRLENVVIPAVQRLLDVARKHDIPTFFITIGPERADGADYAEWKRNRNRTMQDEAGPRPVYFYNGTSEHGVLHEIAPTDGDVVLNKITFNALTSTSLDLSLRSLGRDTLFFGGQAANVCVQSTAFDAADRGYKCVLVEDAVAAWDPELHAATVRNFGLMYGAVANVDQAVSLLAEGGSATGRGLPQPEMPPVVYMVDVEVAGCDVDEFNNWYERVHVPEVLACPGFRNTRRWRSRDGAARFLAVYELDGEWAMQTPELGRVRGWKQFEPFATARTGVFAPISQRGAR